MNEKEIEEIESIIKILGSIDYSGRYISDQVFECVQRLYKIIKPYLDEEQVR